MAIGREEDGGGENANGDGGGGEGDGDEEDGDGAGWRSGRRSVTMVMGREEGGDRDGGV